MDQLEALAKTVRRPEQKSDVPVDHGREPTHPWRLDEQHHLQPAPAHRQDFQTGLWAVLSDRSAFCLRYCPGSGYIRPSSTGRHGGEKTKSTGKKAEHIWQLPEGTIPGKVGYHAVLQKPHVERWQAERLLGDVQ